MPNIHPTAIIEKGALLHESVRVGPFSIIEAGAIIGADCIIESNVRIYNQTRLGRSNRVGHGATLGSEPQDLSYSPDQAKPLTIGDGNQFKEGANISHGIKEDHGTVIGNNNYFMAFTHVGHDCIIGDHNIFANTATLAGHVTVENRVFLSGHTAVHQFCRIGSHVMVAGVSGVPQDIPPFALADGHRAMFVGLNVIGLRRAGLDQSTRNTIKRAYKLIYHSGLKLADAIEQLKVDNPIAEVQQIIRFIEGSKRGIISHR